jgi:hypothetical protein
MAFEQASVPSEWVGMLLHVDTGDVHDYDAMLMHESRSHVPKDEPASDNSPIGA